jgi:pyridoxine 5-phosphate synthase
MARLGFNLEGVAGLREKAGITDADPVKIVFFAELGGVEAVICPISDEFRPFTERDVKLLRSLTKVRFEVRVSAVEKLISAALSVRPDGVTLLPRGTTDATPQGGLNVAGREDELGRIVQELRGQNAAAAFFVDPVLAQIKAAAGIGADGVELNARVLVSVKNFQERGEALEALVAAALAACKLGLDVAVSGGVTYQNASMLAGIEKVETVVVGRSIVGRALYIGMEQAVRDMVALVH